MTTARVTKRRTLTRQRLLDAAFDAFAEEGFGHSTVEKVCERAGFTRGAFYSNFTSLDELFLAMWEQRSAELLADIHGVLDELDATGVTDLDTMLDLALTTIPLDDKWFRVQSEFAAHALRNPSLRRVLVAREDAIVATLMPVFAEMLERIGRTVPDLNAFGQALIAVHDGTMAQCLLDPDNPEPQRRRRQLFRTALLGYSAPAHTD